MLFATTNTTNARRLPMSHQGKALDVWLAHATREQFDPTFRSAREFLATSESERLDAMKFPKRRESFVLGRLAAKEALAASFGEVDLSKIQIDTGVFGQPLVNYNKLHSREVSIAHSEGIAIALAYPSAYPMAVDVEQIESGRADTVRKELKFSMAEEEWVRSEQVTEDAAYILLWTFREALAKALKCGIVGPFESFTTEKIKNIGDGIWSATYSAFQQFKAISQIKEDRVISMAFPAAVEIQMD